MASMTAKDKRITLAEVARQARVSIPVAGMIVNGGKGNNSRASEETIRRVQRVARRLNYRPNLSARQLRGKRAQLIGLLVTSAGDPSRALLVERLDRGVFDLGCHTLIANTVGGHLAGPDRFQTCVEEMAHRGVDGVLCVVSPWAISDRQRLMDAHPHTVFYEDPGIAGATWVGPDRADAARRSAAHLAKRGRRAIALALLDLEWDFYRKRIEGHLQGLCEAGVDQPEQRIYLGRWRELEPELENGMSRSFAYLDVLSDQFIDEMILPRRVDAVVMHDDYWAGALIRRLSRRGICVPDDVAVIGFGNHYLAPWTDPPLTTMDLCYTASADAMVRLLERMVNKGDVPKDERGQRIPSELVVRDST